MTNKETLILFAKVLLVMILAMITIISGAAVWNAAAVGAASTFYVVVSVINFIAEGVGIYFLSRKVLFKKSE